MMMLVLVSKQHKVTTKYKMQATPHFSVICQLGEDRIIQKCRASRFKLTNLGFNSSQFYSSPLIFKSQSFVQEH